MLRCAQHDRTGFVLHSIALKINASLHAIVVEKRAPSQKDQGGLYPTLVFRPCPAFPTTCLACVVDFSLLDVPAIAHALVLERLLKCAQAALNLVALL